MDLGNPSVMSLVTNYRRQSGAEETAVTELTSASLLAKLAQLRPLITPMLVNINPNLFLLRGGVIISLSIKMIAAFGCLEELFKDNPGLDWAKVKILDASSGNFALALAYLCKFLGLKCKVIVNSSIPPQTKELIERFGAEIEIGGATTKICYDCAIDLAGKKAGEFMLTNQLTSWANPFAHRKITAEPILTIQNLTSVIATGGSHGVACGILMRLKEIEYGGNLIIVRNAKDSPRSIVGTASVEEGKDFVTPFMEYVNRDTSGIVKMAIVDSDAAQRGMRELFEEIGLYPGYSSGAVYAAYKERKSHGVTCLVLADEGYRWDHMFPW